MNRKLNGGHVFIFFEPYNGAWLHARRGSGAGKPGQELSSCQESTRLLCADCLVCLILHFPEFVLRYSRRGEVQVQAPCQCSAG